MGGLPQAASIAQIGAQLQKSGPGLPGKGGYLARGKAVDQEQGHFLLGGEIYLRQVVFLLEDAIPHLLAEGVHLFHFNGDPHLPELALIPLEHAFEGGHGRLLVAGDGGADAVQGDRAIRLQEHGDEVDEPLGLVHRPPALSQRRLWGGVEDGPGLRPQFLSAVDASI